jgi:hypothetical protein
MLIDASVARSFAVLGWTRQLLQACGGRILAADGVDGAGSDDPSELGASAPRFSARPSGQGWDRDWPDALSLPSTASTNCSASARISFPSLPSMMASCT